MTDLLATVRTALGLLPPALRRRWLALLPAAALSALAEVAGAGAVLLLVRVLSDPASAASLPVVSRLAAGLSPQEVTLAVAAAASIVFLGKSLLAAGVAALVAAVQSRTVGALSERVLETYLSAPWSFHLERRSSSLIHRAGRLCEEIARMALQSAVSLAAELLVVGALLAVLLAAAPSVTLAACLVLGALLLTVVRATRRASRRAGAELLRLEEEVQAQLRESLGILKELRILGRERAFLDDFARLQREAGKARRRALLAAGLSLPVVEAAFVTGLLAVLCLVSLGGTGPELLSMLGLFAYAGFRVIPSANRIVLHTHLIRGMGPGVESLAADIEQLDCERREELQAGPEPPPPFASLELQDVSYAFEGETRPALDGVDLELRRGESVGLVGPTGAGKSTLVDVLLGLLRPTRGRVLVDGRSVFDELRGWRRRVGYVPQQAFLLDTTLRRNIACGIPEAEVDEARLGEAVRLAQLAGFVAGLPEGLQTRVGERGIRLSGGERQRVVIARALYHGPELLVLDEATSALDNETERELARAVEALHGERTLLVVAHRLETVRRCDRLVFLADGRVEAEGSWDELLARSEGFRRMVPL